MKLYSMPGTCAISVHISLEWIGKPFEVEVMAHGDNRLPAYLAINPSGLVPALILDDGRVLTQASAILAWLADTHRNSQLGVNGDNADQRFVLNELLAHLTSDVHVSFGPFFAPARFLDDAASAPALKATSLARVATHMNTLDLQLGDRATILPSGRSVADAYLYVLTRWADYLPQGISPFKNLARFRKGMEADPAVQRSLAAQGMKPAGG